MAECASLLMMCTARYRGFESRSLRLASLNSLAQPRRNLHKFLRGFVLCDPLRDRAAPVIAPPFSGSSSFCSSGFFEVGIRRDEVVLLCVRGVFPSQRVAMWSGCCCHHGALLLVT